MADEATSPSPEISQDAPAAGSGIPKSIFLISYPKVVFLYPTFLAALSCGLYMTFSGAEPTDSSGVLVTTLFLCVLAVNMIVLSFDFPRTTSLTLFFFVAAIITGGVLLFRTYPDLVPAITDFLKLFHPYANSHFFYFFATMIGIIFIAVAINVQFDYWEVRPNELLHHHGILSDLKRYSAPNLRIDKEINDVFEYVLLRSGRLILQARGESRAIILENVFFINRKEEQLTRMLGALQVQVRDQNAAH